MANQGTRRLGTICRLYKNASNKIIATECVEIVVDVICLENGKFHRKASTPNVKRKLFHLETGGSRVVSTIQSIGDYSAITEDSGNFFITTWDGSTTDENDVVISLKGFVAAIGDTV